MNRLGETLLEVGYLEEFEAGGPTVEEKTPEEEWKQEFYDKTSGALLKESRGCEATA